MRKNPFLLRAIAQKMARFKLILASYIIFYYIVFEETFYVVFQQIL